MGRSRPRTATTRRRSSSSISSISTGSKVLVAELGWTGGDDGILEKNGVKLSFAITGDQDESFNKQLGTVIQDQLKQLGVEVSRRGLDRGTYFGSCRRRPGFVLLLLCSGRCRSTSSPSSSVRHRRGTKLGTGGSAGSRRGDQGVAERRRTRRSCGGRRAVPTGGGGVLADDSAWSIAKHLGGR